MPGVRGVAPLQMLLFLLRLIRSATPVRVSDMQRRRRDQIRSSPGTPARPSAGAGVHSEERISGKRACAGADAGVAGGR